jgi:hypothetical protein
MSYPITLTANSASLITPLMPSGILADGSIDTSTGITLIGRNYTNYGDAQNENFLHLLENFADSVPPTASSSVTVPLTGTLWYDTAGQRIRVYDGTNWSTVSERIVSNTAPTTATYTIKAGDQWYDSINQQLNSWNGSNWQLIGPAYTASQGLSGAIVTTIVDTNNVSHTVVNNYTNGNLISITSYDPAFTPLVAISGFSTITPGINLSTSETLNGTAINSTQLGNVVASSYARIDIADTFASDVNINGNLVLTNANIHYTNNSLILHNHAYQGNVDVYLNSPLGNINSLHIDGSTGLATVYGNPISSNGIANKNYVDSAINSTNSNVVALSTAVVANVASLTANAASQQTQINSINTTIPTLATLSYLNSVAATLAPINSPTLTGTPQAPTPASNDNSTKIATTAYVSSAINVINAIIPNLATTSNVNAAVANLAPIHSPALTGTPTAPTQLPGDSTTKLATTQFVSDAITANQFNYTVSSSPPSGGNPGDFWFQVG